MAAEWDEEYDVVVVGSGAGALTGAYLAARRGMRTAVLEKTAYLGGTSAYSGAACWLPGTSVQQRAGIPDSTESARTYLRSLIGDREVDRQEAFLRTAPRVAALLEEDPAIAFEWRPFPDYFAAPGRVDNGRSFVPLDLPREELGDLLSLVRPPVERDRTGKGHYDAPLTAGRALIGRLLLALHRTGSATIRTEHGMDRLLVEDGRVVGVEAVTLAGRVRIGARRGVLLAAGGFERNPELRGEHAVPGGAAWSMAPAGTNLGEPMLAAVAEGAATDLLDQGWWCPGLAMPDGGASFTLGFRGGLVVDRGGQRYANESLPYDQMGRQMAASPDRSPSYVIFDSRSGGQLPAISVPGGRPEQHLAAGTWVTAGTLEELAGLIDVPAPQLAATVARFNKFAEVGVDEDHHRGEDQYDQFFAAGDGPNKALVPVDTPPYFAARLVLSDLGTKGGLRTDARGRVLTTDGAPLPGLYAAGNTASSMTGEVYPGPGIPIATAMVFAALAVEDMVDDLVDDLVGR